MNKSISQIGKNIRLDGNVLASKLGLQLKQNIQKFMTFFQQQTKKHTNVYIPISKPKLSIINVGNNIGSLSYIKKKMKMAVQVGIDYHLHQFNVLVQKDQFQQQYQEVQNLLKQIDVNNFNKYVIDLEKIQKLQDEVTIHRVKQEQAHNKLSCLIQQLNKSQQTSALFIQLPLQQSLVPFTDILINLISPSKDADCLTPTNRLKVFDHKHIAQLLPCTPRAILKILEQNNIKIEGMNAVMVGRSDLVGKPLSHLLLNQNATTTVCHKMTKDVNFFTKHADLVISATGVSNLVTQVKEGAILIDVGISRDQNGKLSGDISLQAKKKAAFYTPVPGGVGPLTVVMLMENVYQLWKAQNLQKISLIKTTK